MAELSLQPLVLASYFYQFMLFMWSCLSRMQIIDSLKRTRLHCLLLLLILKVSFLIQRHTKKMDPSYISHVTFSLPIQSKSTMYITIATLWTFPPCLLSRTGDSRGWDPGRSMLLLHLQREQQARRFERLFIILSYYDPGQLFHQLLLE